ncbi:MAG TPA: hypothetical protein VGE21_05340, partial [Flavobacteriales bacterium]
MTRPLRLVRTILFAFLGLLLLAGLAFSTWAYRDGQEWLDRTVRERIEAAVAKATVSGYHFRMDTLGTRFRSGDVLIHGIQLDHDSSLNDSLRAGVHEYLFAAQARTIALRGLSIWRAVLLREVHVRSIEVDGPLLQYTIGDHRVALKAPFERLKGSGSNPPLFSVEVVIVRDARAIMQDLSGRLPVLNASGLDILAEAVNVTHTGNRRRADLHVGEVDLALDSLSANIAGGYRLHFGAVHLSDRMRRGRVRDISLHRTDPGPSKHRTTELGLHVDSIVFDAPDIGGLIADQALRMKALSVHGLDLEATLDKELPEGPLRPVALPPAALLALPFPVRIDSVHLVDNTLRYRERSDATGRWGTITFNALDATFSGIDNTPDRPQDATGIEGRISCLFMDTARLSAHYTAEVEGGQDFTFTATVQQLPFAALDTLTSNLLRLSLSSGTLDRMHLVMKGNERKARGTMDLHYTDLVATISEQATPAQRHSMFGSVMDHVMTADNGGGLSDRQKRSYSVERDQQRSLLTFIWHFTRS